MCFVQHEILSSFVYGTWVLGANIFSAGLGVKLKSQSRQWNSRHLSLSTKKPALLQNKLFSSNYSWVLDDRFAVLKKAVDILLT